ncbi:MAG: aminotransferase class V-fold PLP-dependent enzyme [Rhodobacteraceae bacterium]|nr:aminotransferase class V-fold PLP-dependent enzyme [Paracoccaceae bacterium]
MSKLDIEFVRAQFPAFKEPTLQGQAFFENAGGSYTSKFVIDRLHCYYSQRKVQPYAPYGASKIAGEEMDEGRTRLAGVLNIPTNDLSFGPSTTQNIYVLAQAFRQILKAGDAIIVTNQDHEANSGPWRKLADSGILVREWAVDKDTGFLDVADLANLLDDKVKLVAFPHVSNIVGQINPVAEICAIVKAAGAVTCVDGVSFAPHGLPDIKALGADIYLFSAYKTYGPHQGIMYVDAYLAKRLPNQAHHFNAGSPYKRFTPAGPDHAQIAASAGMVDYIEAVHDHHFDADESLAEKARAMLKLQQAHEAELMAPLLEYLRARNDVRLIGADKVGERVSTVAIGLKRAAEEVARDLAKHGIMAGGGDFYAGRLIERLGINPEHGVLRLSFVHYTTAQEVEQLMKALDQTL